MILERDMFDYRVPGVYRQEATVGARQDLQTGVPAFIGFAESRSVGETSAPLDVLPDELQFPAEVAGRVRYDGDARQLIFSGAMSDEDFEALLALSADESYTAAVQSLYVASQGEGIWNRPVALFRQADFDSRFEGVAGCYLGDAVTGFFGNGGVKCYVVRCDPRLPDETSITTALDSLVALNDIDLVAAPDAMTLMRVDEAGVERQDVQAITRVQKALLDHCAVHGGRFAILDSLLGLIASEALSQLKALVVGISEPANGALYYPWLRIDGGRLVPPSGHVAGVYARTDAQSGYFKAPANVQILGVIDLETPVDNSIQDQLNPEGINCLRAFPGRGIRVWGARTVSRDPAWRYVNVRRLFLTLQRWVDLNMAWATFEPNSPALWVRITRELTSFLNDLWQAGALVGETAEQAYFVKCDSETNSAEVRDAGQAITEVGLAPGSPAEFVVVRIVHHIGVEPR